MSSVFDSIPMWALTQLEPPKPPDESAAIAQAAANLAALQAQAQAEFDAAPPKRKPGRPKGSKSTKQRGRLAAPDPASDA